MLEFMSTASPKNSLVTTVGVLSVQFWRYSLEPGGIQRHIDEDDIWIKRWEDSDCQLCLFFSPEFNTIRSKKPNISQYGVEHTTPDFSEGTKRAIILRRLSNLPGSTLRSTCANSRCMRCLC